MKIGIFTGDTSVRSKNITAISRYPTGKHEIRGGKGDFKKYSICEKGTFLRMVCELDLPLFQTGLDRGIAVFEFQLVGCIRV